MRLAHLTHLFGLASYSSADFSAAALAKAAFASTYLFHCEVKSSLSLFALSSSSFFFFSSNFTIFSNKNSLNSRLSISVREDTVETGSWKGLGVRKSVSEGGLPALTYQLSIESR